MNRMIWADLAGRLNAFGTVAVAYDGRAMAYSRESAREDGLGLS